MSDAVFETSISSLPLIGRGKVRDNYAIGEHLMLMVATDRLSAFDVIMSEPIPGKGKMLTKMALFWFEHLKGIVPNHLTSGSPGDVVSIQERSQVTDRAMLVKRLKPVQVEAVVRGYLAGSGWVEYQRNNSVCGVQLPNGLLNASQLPAPIFTPATKAPSGSHDENISFAELINIVGADLAAQIRDVSLQLYDAAAKYALAKGIIIADTKFEFGLDENENLTLMDEVLTPDSSRFWDVDTYTSGKNPPSFDKQFVRDWLETASPAGEIWNKKAPAPTLPRSVVEETARRYAEALDRILT